MNITTVEKLMFKVMKAEIALEQMKLLVTIHPAL